MKTCPTCGSANRALKSACGGVNSETYDAWHDSVAEEIGQYDAARILVDSMNETVSPVVRSARISVIGDALKHFYDKGILDAKGRE